MTCSGPIDSLEVFWGGPLWLHFQAFRYDNFSINKYTVFAGAYSCEYCHQVRYC